MKKSFLLKQVLPLTGLLLWIFLSCKNKTIPKPLFSRVEQSGISFTNSVTDKKELNIINYRNFYNGGGVAIGDINNDGLADVFFTANQGPNKLFLNKGNWQFEDISQKAGFGDKKQWSTGVVMADINSDGWLDIYVCNAGSMEDSSLRRNQLFINNKALGFTDSAAAYGLDDYGYTTQVSFFDYDLDGDLDCFMINNSPISPVGLNYVNKRDLPDKDWPVASVWKGGGDHLFRNDHGRFTEISKEAGIYGSTISFGLGVTVGDVNGDGYPDIYVSNDFYERDYLYINQQNGSYRDELEQWMQHTSLASMGADFGDINNDGFPDIFTTDMLPGEDYRMKTTLAFEDINIYRLKIKNGFYHQFFQNTLQLNNRNGKFADIANFAGVAATDWSWGGLMFDADNDGNNDLFVCNGIYRDLINQDFLDFSASDIMRKMIATGQKEDLNVIIDKMPSILVPNKMFRNLGGLRFQDIGEQWGLSEPSFSNGAAYGDLDNDGDLDMIVNNVNQPAFVYRNHANERKGQHYIAILLQGKGRNSFAIGSTIKIYRGAEVLTREIVPSRGFQSSVDYKTIIGLGAEATIDSMIIQWPDRLISKYMNPATDTVHMIKQVEAKMETLQPLSVPAGQPLLQLADTSFDKHQEDDYVDFFYERNLPRMLSREGPRSAIADVNGDGLEDIFISGTAGYPGQLYLQQAGGGFLKKDEKIFRQFSDFEDAAVLFFDSDKDKDADLLLTPGGNNVAGESRQLQMRLFKNDGKGNFSIDASAFPLNQCNIGVAIAHDIDKDGDQDLFVGGRSVPRQYGLTPASYLFINDGKGKFTDVAGTKYKELAELGMVTAAAWADITGDKDKELIVVGEWMAPRVFSFNRDRVEEVQTNLSRLYGWWQTISIADMDGDGLQDLVLGNIGENFYLHPDADRPVKIWVNDFDKNGITDKVLTYTIDGTDKPVFLKRDLEDAMPFLKKNNLKHADYAVKTVQELLPKEELGKAVVKQFNYSSSCIAYNQGNGKFAVQKLPAEIQLSSVNAVFPMDLNSDGNIDLVLGGNIFDFMPQLERLDASLGWILLNKGKRMMETIDARQSGLEIRGQLKDIAEIKGNNRRWLLFLQNNERPRLYGVGGMKAAKQH
ncbi:MAG TPA: VCBS repeat-containing protein [Chitinophagaceae bacterium]|nr:VCBS repeat-containing protein [Chitinophagaceae bacterium]